MNWIAFKDQLPEVEGHILVRDTIRPSRDADEIYYYYEHLSAEPVEGFEGRHVWVRQTGYGKYSACLSDIRTNSYMSSQHKTMHWLRLPPK